MQRPEVDVWCLSQFLSTLTFERSFPGPGSSPIQQDWQSNKDACLQLQGLPPVQLSCVRALDSGPPHACPAGTSVTELPPAQNENAESPPIHTAWVFKESSCFCPCLPILPVTEFHFYPDMSIKALCDSEEVNFLALSKQQNFWKTRLNKPRLFFFSYFGFWNCKK